MNTVHWQLDPADTEAAKRIFNAYEPTVMRNGRNYLLENTQWGRMLLISCGALHVVAAEHPPQATVAPLSLPQETLHHLESNNLHLWTTVRSSDLASMLREISEKERGDQGIDEPWSPYTCPMDDTAAELIGEQRGEVCDRLTALLDVWRSSDPLLCVIGPEGVGKHVLAMAAAGQLDLLRAVELPLGRLFVDRIFPTGFEVFLSTILRGAVDMDETDLLVVSDTQLLDALAGPVRDQILRELSRVPRVLLLSHATAPTLAGIIALECPGLADLDEAQQLVALEFPGSNLEGPTLEMLCRAASGHEVGIIPARLLSLVRMGLRLSHAGEALSATLRPDDAAAAIGLVKGAWEC